ncbi:MAG: PQQ-binding-like beta-propeller repeat protein [Flavobacteriales bacterium]|nr:PQQ-binding-like beta-propeller repeat protein [Flavobacteriales bacterium]
MKKQIITALSCCMLSLGLMAQEEMQTEWTQKYDHKTQWVGTGLEGPDKVSFIATEKKITVFKTSDGSIVWNGAYKNIVPKFRKVDAFAPFWESGAIFLFDKKLGKDKLAVVDLKTGKVLWDSEVYQGLTVDNIEYIPEKDGFILSLENSLTFVDARTGEEKWESTAFNGAVAMWQYIEGDLVMLNFAPPGLRAFFRGFKNQLARIDLDNGDIKWTTTYSGVPERKIVTKERIYDMNIKGGKVFLTMKGLQVFDVKSGATLWSAAFDEEVKKRIIQVNSPFGKGGKGGKIYGAIADPLIVGRDVYIVQKTRKSKKFAIYKYDINTGKVLWSSEQFKAAEAIPNIFVINDKLIAQVGGVVEVQSITKSTVDGVTTTTYSVGTKNIKPNGLIAFNTSDGSQVWDSEKFKKGITNAFVDGENLIVSSGKALYSIRFSDGKVNYEEDVKNGGVGLAVEILKYKENIVVIGQKGVSLFTISEGKMVKASKYKKASFQSLEDNILLMRTAKNDFAAFNLDDCTYVKYNAKKDSQQALSTDGKFVWAYEKKQVTKLKTR